MHIGLVVEVFSPGDTFLNEIFGLYAELVCPIYQRIFKYIQLLH